MSYVGILTTSNIPGWECEIRLIQGIAVVEVTGYTLMHALNIVNEQLRETAREVGGNFVLGTGFSHQLISDDSATVIGYGTIVRVTPVPPIA